ncbi:MAG: flagellar hook-associated protein FlgL [Lachnospiraceae bacterium]|nr:flagellar hook-associated protein FlgL [Lachnospiraceae bacterium]
MRITNQMVTGNSLRNMQKSMSAVNKKTEQMTSGKKIAQASDDPVIAIRALKLRTTVNQLEQYKDKNIPDAESWLKITTTSLDNITKRLTDIQSYCVQGSTDSFNSTNRSAIIDSLKELQSMLYSEGNSTYAGRYIFSGFKTDRSLAFTETEDTSKYSYDITQHFTSAALDTKNVVLDGVDYTQVDAYIADPDTYKQPNPEMVYRLNLAYEGISETNNAGTNVLALVAKDKDGNTIDLSAFTQTVIDTDDAADYYRVGKDDIHIIRETGEIIFGENVYNTLKRADDIAVSYAKNTFDAGDLRPEHYFDCTAHIVQSDGSVKDIDYVKPEAGQKIYYEVNFNQSLQVNTEGNQLISEEMSNDINDLIYTLEDLRAAEDAQTRLTAMLKDAQYSANEDSVAQINRMLSDINVEIAVKKENLQKTFSNNIKNFQDYMSEVSAMQSDVGSRMTKLEMVETRVAEQYASFKELKSVNEDVETDEALIAFKEANLVYESALAATGNVMRKSLLDYI